jgi:hypothetical protein
VPALENPNVIVALPLTQRDLRLRTALFGGEGLIVGPEIDNIEVQWD